MPEVNNKKFSIGVADNAGLSVVYADFEDRELFIDEWEYNPHVVNRKPLLLEGLKRPTKERRYFERYTVDNVYELFLFKNTIVVLNKLGCLTGRDVFTLGHHVPMALNGVHYPTNWTIQTDRDNQKAQDFMPDNPVKIGWDEQLEYIYDKLPEEVNSKYAARAIYLLNLLREVY